MIEAILKREGKSAELMAFEYWLRTGHRLDFKSLIATQERKFNPNHDPDDGRFTFGPGGGSLSPRQHRHTDLRVPAKQERRKPAQPAPLPSSAENAILRSGGENAPKLIQAQFRPNPRVRIGGNGPPINDPLIIEHVFPTLQNTPGGAIVAAADNILDITGPSTRLTASLANDYSNSLIRQIRTIDPNYRFDSLGFPQTFDGQMNMIRGLRMDRAVAFHRTKGELRPLQVEVLRHLQEQTDIAYAEGVRRYDAGRLPARLSRNEAIGNFVDRESRRSLRELYNRYGIETSKPGPFRVIGREYDTSGTDPTFRVPDVRVGNIAFDVSLTRKTLATPQVRGFFNSDFRPDAVIIIRPRQLGAGSTYSITRPRNHR